jgi:KDO2-lipid IV(A) lauroyltransferase
MLGSALGVLLRGTGLRARVIRQNLEFAFPQDGKKREVLFREAYRHLGQLVFEIIALLGPMKKFVLNHSELRGLENWKKAREAGNGVIFLASHVGNWEIMAATGAVFGGMDLMIVTKHLKPEWLHRAIEKGRAACGVAATYEPRTLRDVLAHLKRGGTVGFVLDQYAGAPVGVRVPVFGIPVGTTSAVATLAKRTGAVVVPVVNYRRPDGRFVTDIRPPLSWLDASGDGVEAGDDHATWEIATNTAYYAQVLERDIYEHPDQWLWIHRRFKGDLSPLREREWLEGRARK